MSDQDNVVNISDSRAQQRRSAFRVIEGGRTADQPVTGSNRVSLHLSEEQSRQYRRALDFFNEKYGPGSLQKGAIITVKLQFTPDGFEIKIHDEVIDCEYDLWEFDTLQKDKA